MSFFISAKDVRVAEAFPEFYKHVQRIEKEVSPIRRKFTSLTSEDSIYVTNTLTTGAIFSKKAVLIKDCEEVGPITAPIVVLMRCKKTGNIRASHVFSFESDDSGVRGGNFDKFCFTPFHPREMTMSYSEPGIVHGDIHSNYGAVELVDRIVKGAVVFGDAQGSFRGRIYLRGTSKIHDLVRTNADVFYPKDKETI